MTLHGYVTAEITYTTVHACNDILTWPRTTFVLFPLKLHLKSPCGCVMAEYGCVHWVNHKSTQHDCITAAAPAWKE